MRPGVSNRPPQLMRFARRRIGAADPGDEPVFDLDGGVLDEAVAALHRGDPQIGQEHA